MAGEPQPIKRLSLSNDQLNELYGPLAGLIGIWSGNKGVNLIAVPDQKGRFTLLVAPYSETLTVTPISSPTPNRGLKTIEQIPTLLYTLSIYNSIDNSLMHVENGVWELLNKSTNGGFDLARIGTVPHGDALLALGTSSIASAKPVIPDISASPTGSLPAFFGYTDVYDVSPVPGFQCRFPNRYLMDYLKQQEAKGQRVVQTINLPVSTKNKGGITNIPSIDQNAKAKTLESFFWVETVLDNATGQTFQQLQYSQNTIIEFPIKENKPGETIQWPHVNVNTLVKQ